MPKIAASMKEVSTDYNPVEPGVHRFQIEHCKENKDENTGRVSYEVKNKIIGIIESGKESDIGRSVTERIHIHLSELKDGQPQINEMGLGQLKRYFEVTVGEKGANDPNADTDWIVGQQFIGQTEIEQYKVKDSLTGKEEVRKKNSIPRKAPLK